MKIKIRKARVSDMLHDIAHDDFWLLLSRVGAANGIVLASNGKIVVGDGFDEDFKVNAVR